MENKKGISGSTLKMIAIVTMVIDHIGAAVLARLLMVNGLGELDQTNADALCSGFQQMEHCIGHTRSCE